MELSDDSNLAITEPISDNSRFYVENSENEDILSHSEVSDKLAEEINDEQELMSQLNFDLNVSAQSIEYDEEQILSGNLTSKIDYEQLFKEEIKIANENKNKESQFIFDQSEFVNSSRRCSSEIKQQTNFINGNFESLNLNHNSCFDQRIKNEILSDFSMSNFGSSIFDSTPFIKKQNLLLNFDFIPEFNNETENRHFLVVNQIFSLLDSNIFLMKVIEQLRNYVLIKNDFDSELEKLVKKQTEENYDGKNLSSSQICDDKITAKFRFGHSLKDIFHGYEFDYICWIILVTLSIKKGFIKINNDSEKETISIEFDAAIQTDALTAELFGNLSVSLQISLNRSVSSRLFSEQKGFSFAKFYKNGKITIPRSDFAELFVAELEGCFSRRKIKDLCSFEVCDESVIFWIVNNMTSEFYFPYCFCVAHFTKSFFSLYGAVLNVKSLKREALQNEKFYEFEIELLDFAKDVQTILKNEAFFPIFLHKKLTLTKNRTEILFDFCCLCFKLDLHLLPLDSEFEELLFKKIDYQKTKKTHSNIFQFEEFKKTYFQFYEKSKKIVENYLFFRFSFEKMTILYKFLNDPTSLMVLKQVDHSFLIRTFEEWNNKFLEYLQMFPKIESPVESFKKYLLNSDPMQTLFEVEPEFQSKTNVTIAFHEIELLKIHLFVSQSVVDSFVSKIKNEQTILQNVVCFHAIHRYWENMDEEINKVINPTNSAMNADVNNKYRFFVDSHKRLQLQKETNEKVKGTRRLKPEMLFDIQIWMDLSEYVEQMHWKVQNGLFAWFAIFVFDFPYKRHILNLFNKFRIRVVHTRATAIKYFGVFSKLYKLLDDAKHIEGFEEEFQEREFCRGIPIEIMVDIDCIFGYCETSKTENCVWDKEFVDHLEEWMNRKTKENLFGIDIADDFELFFDHLMTDMKTTISKGIHIEKSILIYIEKNYFDEKEALFFGITGKLFCEEKKYRYLDISDVMSLSFNFGTYQSFCNNFLNFSASGSAKKATFKMREAAEFKKLREKDNYLAEKILKKTTEKTVEEKRENQKTVSKTICFAYFGKKLPLFFIDVYGSEYVPQLNCVLKKEAKKLRHVINADLISFSKQSFIHDWLKEALSPNIAKKINSLLNPRQRILSLFKMKSTLNFEKWCVPIDLKDFHHHFGKSHYNSFGRVLLQKLEKNVKSVEVRRDLFKILRVIGDDLSKGSLLFSFDSEEENLFTGYQFKYNEKWRITKQKKIKIEDETQKFKYSLMFEVNNGLMSGWKMTSLFGSLFNLTLNDLSQFFTIIESSDLLFDLNVMGDDTHLKRRQLASSINHISFVNMCGKIAHPDKQIISPISSEFLKKKINTVTKNVSFSNNRTWSSLLFSSNSKKDILSTPNFIKDTVDLWNLFLSRIDSQLIRDNLIKRDYFKQYFIKFANLQTIGENKKEKEKDKNHISECVAKMLNSPIIISGFMAGPLRSKLFPFGLDSPEVIDCSEKFVRVKAKKVLKIFELDYKPGNCKGISTTVNKIMRPHYNQNVLWISRFRRELTNAIAEEIFNGKAQFHYEESLRLDENSDFRNEKELINFVSLDSKTDPILVYNVDSSEFSVTNFLDFAFEIIRENIHKNHRFSGLSGGLIYQNEKISRIICNLLKELHNSPTNLWPIIQALMKLSRNSETNFQIIKKSFEVFGGRVCLSLASTTDFIVSSSRNFKLDEIIGYLNYFLSKCLVFYFLEHKKKIANCSPEKIELFFKQILMTLDLYLHQYAEQTVAKLNRILEDKIAQIIN